MAIVGYSYPVLAKYTNTEGTITYSEGRQIGHGVSFSTDITTTDDNNLWGDNHIVETAPGTFQSGTLSMDTTELLPSVSAWLLGIEATEISFTPAGSSTAVTVNEYHYNDDIKPENLGFGCIEKHIINGEVLWLPRILTKILSKIPASAATTQGETIDWQTKSIEFTIQRDDSSKHEYQVDTDFFDTEDEAKAYINYKLNISNS